MSGPSIAALAILIGAYVLLALEAIAEAGVVSLSRSRARLLLSRAPEDPTRERLQRITQNRERALGSFAVGRTIAVVTSLAAAEYLLIREQGFSWEVVVGTAVVGFLVAGLTQAVPRRLAQSSPEGYGLMFARTMDALDTLFLIPAVVLEAPARLVSRFRKGRDEHAPEPTELEVLLEEGEEEIEEDEREMIRRVVEIGDTAVREAMVPRPDIVAVEVELTARQAAQVAVDNGYSRVPVSEGSIDNIVGVLYAKDALATLLAGQETPVRELMRTPLLVPETKLLDELLAEFRALRVHMAIVLDEYGGTAGIVTLEDLLEEVVGEIEDEYDRFTASPVYQVSDTEAILDGRADSESLTELFGYRFEDEDFDTVGGFVFDRLGKIPEPGDEVRVDGLVLTVVRMDGRRIARVRAQAVTLSAGETSSPAVEAVEQGQSRTG